jgi:hypothetical protein
MSIALLVAGVAIVLILAGLFGEWQQRSEVNEDAVARRLRTYVGTPPETA